MSSAKAFTFLPLGAIIQKFTVNGKNIVQGFPSAELYKQYNAPFFGETIGRIANRVSKAKINDLNGKSYQLAINDGPNSLHGGDLGFGKREFEGPSTVDRNGKEATFFKYLSKDGEEGYPGTLEVRVWYVQEKENVDGAHQEVLHIEYEAELVGDEVSETAINMTNHSYFNLTGGPSIAGTEVNLITNKYQVVDDGGIPTGPIEEYPGVSAKKTFTLGEKEPDIDDCFVANTDPSSIPIDTRSSPLQKLASFYHPESKIHLEVHSTEPAFQFYTGKYIDVPAVGDLSARGARSGFCVEPSRYVNAINIPEYKSMMVLKKGEKYGTKIVYRGWQA
ncbi:bifunctional protein GAL10 [Pyrenophora tritici-repentis]|uniref:Aldose-epim domain containing protein n=2 Tax=Pyrenophora tritici-repentis TaxID=45151 RepID=A0A2W1FWS0_9PLEO|nr:bifunctional protein GAL10 [Pyrenophora tritici-repentis Pt-1C-BFP]KAA8613455.1 Bifunctional protein GAL10 [Pyrenophora tritici-repentis]EDU49312.1 bifunctional protein GAL10 [Pyrenophora tritici-repentis Pt-1C-BFP]KAF7445166.1 Bifunctional protein [Pyrenophora tritici-repentis]KAF7565433.1 Aldose-epim domain containing protein [Pyrenophora tritici-repentis]KAG9380432.1 Bifunctional protein GAL10 [Pyrenophora tritici-repentis]